MIKICPFCGREFEAGRIKYCSEKCRIDARNKHNHDYYYAHREELKAKSREYQDKKYGRLKAVPAKEKPLEIWAKEAEQCGMTYGKYRSAVEFFGKTFDELKLR